MSIQEQRRAAFEANHPLPDGMYFDHDSNQYAGHINFWLFTDRLNVWNAALDSVVIELPDSVANTGTLNSTAVLSYKRECREAIEAAGLKVAP